MEGYSSQQRVRVVSQGLVCHNVQCLGSEMLATIILVCGNEVISTLQTIKESLAEWQVWYCCPPGGLGVTMAGTPSQRPPEVPQGSCRDDRREKEGGGDCKSWTLVEHWLPIITVLTATSKIFIEWSAVDHTLSGAIAEAAEGQAHVTTKILLNSTWS